MTGISWYNRSEMTGWSTSFEKKFENSKKRIRSKFYRHSYLSSVLLYPISQNDKITYVCTSVSLMFFLSVLN